MIKESHIEEIRMEITKLEIKLAMHKAVLNALTCLNAGDYNKLFNDLIEELKK